MTTNRIGAIALCAALLATNAVAQTGGVRAPLRELSTDRPDRTESAFTVNAGHTQIEMDIANFTDDRRGGLRTQSFGFGAVNMKVGLRSNIDLQIVTELVTIEHDGPGSTTRSSVSDVTARLKINFWGNDGGTTAFALMPYVTMPRHTAGRGISAIEAGLIAPLAIDAGHGFGVGVMSQLDVVHRDGHRGMDINVLHSATMSHDLVGPFGAYVEAVGEIIARKGAQLVATGDAGITIGVTPDLQIDFGANIGMTRRAERVNAFVGISKRY